MKHRIKNYVSLIVALSMLLSLIPLTSAALDDEFAGFETLEEIPFTFELEPGDLPWEELESAVLAASDIPACISPALAEARGHVNRLYQQEPDDYTVMFQNRDGSKTIYVFSYPVKSSGTSVSTTAAIQVNNGRIVFSGNNIITSRIGVDIKDYSIGYCEIQTLSGGILTSDGVNITEDARGWARGESSASNLVYNMSSEAAAEYNMSVSSNATVAAVTPGITITPIDPIPSGGVTVMAISYSTLTGLMSFMNMSTNQYLSLSTSASPSLTTSSSIVNPYSRWYVQYDSEVGYYVSNLSDVYNTYLGFSGTNVLFLNSAPDAESGLTLSIVSQSEGTVTIDCYEKAINSNGTIYVTSSADYEFPTSCQWKIVSKLDATLVSSISVTSTTRIEQSGVGFYLDYNVNPADASYYSISLYYANNNQEVTCASDPDENDEYAYYINTPGVYSVYYMDSITGIKSEDFSLIVRESESFNDNYTYMIQPSSVLDQFLTMTVTSDLASNHLSLSSIVYSKQGTSEVNSAEKWDNMSKTFTIRVDESNSSYYNISATLAMSQYNSTDPITAFEYESTYTRVTLNTAGITNSINCDISNNNIVVTKSKSDSNSEMRILKINDTYFIICGIDTNSNFIALKYVYDVTNEKYKVEASVLDPTKEEFRWKITHVGVDVPCIRQTRDYVCGYTTLLQVIMGAGLDITVDQSFIGTDGDTNDDLDAKMKTIWKITQNMNGRAEQGEINTYISLLRQSGYVTGDSHGSVVCTKDENVVLDTDEELYDKLIGSMRTEFAPWIFTRKGYSPYTASSDGAHYIAIAGVYYSNDNNPNNDFVIISNCHYHDNVFGIYVISFADFRDACECSSSNLQYLYYCE